jgi:DNA polymerase III epsilon subunit-like protein
VSPVPDASLSAEDLLADQAASSWLRSAVQSALERDPVDALNDALVLAEVLDAHLRRELGLEDPS